jgi:sugar lactone lactonase YvrE
MTRQFRSSLTALFFALITFASIGTAARAQGVKLRTGPSISIDSKGGGLLGPRGVACGGKLLAVADTGNGRFALYDVADRVFQPKSEFAVAEIGVPIEVHFDPKGSLLALDGKSRRIGRVGLDGSFQGFIAIDSGGGPPPVVRAFALGKDGSLYVLDVAGGQVLVNSGEGKLVRQVALPADCRAPSGVAIDVAGKIFVPDAAGPRLYAATKDQATMVPITGSLAEDMDFAGAVAVDGQGRVFVADAHGGGIVVFGSDGSFRGRQSGFGWLDGQMRWPASLCLGEGGTLAVADGENNRIVTFLIAP